MFILKNLKFRSLYHKGIVFCPTHLSNYRDFLNYENENTVLNTFNSSVCLTSKNIEINLQLNKELFKLEDNLLYDVHIKHTKFDDKTNKNVYKILKVVISDEVVKESEKECEEETDAILEDYEISEMYEKMLMEVNDKIRVRQDKLLLLQNKFNNMEKNLINLNSIADLNNNFDRLFEKNYI